MTFLPALGPSSWPRILLTLLLALAAALSCAWALLLGLCFGAWLRRLHAGHLAHLTPAFVRTAPGGIAEMAITVKVLQLGMPVVRAFQVCRLVAVLVLAEPVYCWRYRQT